MSERYDRTTIGLHWVTAILIAYQWLVGSYLESLLGRGPLRSNIWSLHVVLGFVLTAVLVWRVIWRGGPGRGLPAADPPALHVLAKGTHYALYGLLVVVLALGIANAFVRGYNIFGWVALPQVGDRSWRGPLTHWHGVASNILLGLALFHAAAALVHHYVWRDGVLRRMAPGLRA